MVLLKQIWNVLEKTPELNDKFTIRVIIGAMESMQWGRRWDGTGSNKHLDCDEDKINCLISSKLISFNFIYKAFHTACIIYLYCNTVLF